jgi:hypothetical protein
LRNLFVPSTLKCKNIFACIYQKGDESHENQSFAFPLHGDEQCCLAYMGCILGLNAHAHCWRDVYIKYAVPVCSSLKLVLKLWKMPRGFLQQ